MERRDFLFGSLAGVGAAAAVSEVARRLGAEADAARPDAPECDAPPADAVAPAPPPAPRDLSIPPEVGPLPPDGRRLSFAQQGEDLILRNMLESLGIPRPSYLDVGSFHPIVSNNTYLLYAIGGRGVLVEPNPFFAAMSRKLRPEDETLAIGVGIDDTPEAEYFVIADRPQLNTFSREQLDRYLALGLRLERTLKVPLMRISEILDEHFEGTPDLLSIDVEGLDLTILRTMDWTRHRPAVLCVETLVFETKTVVGELVDFMHERDYVVRGGTFVNTIFVDRARLGAGRVTLCPRSGPDAR